MSNFRGSEERPEVAARGATRREFWQRAALLGAGVALPFYNEAALAQDVKGLANLSPDTLRLNANESPVGPCPAALEAIRATLDQGNRYPFRLTDEFIRVMAEVEGLPTSHILPAAGSSDPLHRSVLSFTSPTRPLIVASPGYEAPEGAARFVGAKVVQVPLRKDYSHDPEAMARAHPNAGVIYVCNPNNPTGTVTRKADIEYIVANKPAGCVVLIDEAYIHFSKTATPCVDLVNAGKDVIILRSFSKIYGMAGLRAGAAMGQPALLAKLRGYGGIGFLPAAGLAGATASLKDKAIVPDRRKAAAEVRENLFGWLEKKGYGYLPSEANMVMIDARKPGRAVAAAMLEQKIAIGRTWPAMPTHVRVTIGTQDEMTRFQTVFARVMDS